MKHNQDLDTEFPRTVDAFDEITVKKSFIVFVTRIITLHAVHLVSLLLDIDRGRVTLNVTLGDAMTRIQSQNRFPLTFDEGIALLTQLPELLIKNNCYSLLESRAYRVA